MTVPSQFVAQPNCGSNILSRLISCACLSGQRELVTKKCTSIALNKFDITSMQQEFLPLQNQFIYIQQIEELADKMTPDYYTSLTEKGFFTIQRTDKFWCGFWSDMTIEQVFMRSIKTSGGLAWGCGIRESTLDQWVLALPLCVPMSISLKKNCRHHPWYI